MTHFPRLFALPHKISENRTPPSGGISEVLGISPDLGFASSYGFGTCSRFHMFV